MFFLEECKSADGVYELEFLGSAGFLDFLPLTHLVCLLKAQIPASGRAQCPPGLLEAICVLQSQKLFRWCLRILKFKKPLKINHITVAIKQILL